MNVVIKGDYVLTLPVDTKAGQQVVVRNRKVVAVLLEDAVLQEDAAPKPDAGDRIAARAAKWEDKHRASQHVPTTGDIIDTLTTRGPMTSQQLGEHFRLVAGGRHRELMKQNIKAMLDAGRISQVDPSKRFPQYCVEGEQTA